MQFINCVKSIFYLQSIAYAPILQEKTHFPQKNNKKIWSLHTFFIPLHSLNSNNGLTR